MNENIKHYISNIISNHKKQRINNAKVSILSAIVVFIIFSILTIPVITIEKQEIFDEIKESVILPENETIEENSTSKDSEIIQLPNESVNESSQTEEDTSDFQKVGTGNFQVVIENLPKGLKTDVRIIFIGNKDSGFKEDYDYEIKNSNGNIKSKGRATFNECYSYDNAGYLFKGLELGDVITVLNVEEIKVIYSENMSINAKVEVTPPTEEHTVNYDKGNMLPIKKSETQTIKVSIEKEEVLDVFNNGDYSLEYILGNYNVFSFSDIESKHIIGPIVAKDRAYITGDLLTDKLVASDYSRGISSYVGDVQPLKANLKDSEAKFAINYKFDNFESADKAPTFYTRLSGNKVVKESVDPTSPGYIRYHFYPDDQSKPRFVSPNRSGESKVLQSDNYIDFDKARTSILNESIALVNNESNIKVSPNPETGYLKLDVGKRYIIENASKLRIVDFNYPEGYDPFENPYPYNTIINIQSDSIVKSGESFKGFSITNEDGQKIIMGDEVYGKIGNTDHEFFPIIMVNGALFDGSKDGNNGEYGSNNSIMWNLPNINTSKSGRRVVLQNDSGILGHIVAPSAQFWAYEQGSNGTTTWIGTNMNGCAIVDAWHGGDIESHMWPYTDADTTDISLKSHKNLIGRPLIAGEFKFTLNTIDGTIPDGVLQSNIPQTVSVKENGDIEFLPITFTKPGEYEFFIKEEIPQNPEENITYDKSEYKVIVSVIENIEQSILKSSYKVYKILDSDGNKLEQQVELSDISFTNKYGQVNTIDFSFIKADSNNKDIVLEGAEFELVEVDINNNEIENSNKYSAISNEQGTIQFTDIPLGKKYKMTEVKAPIGYLKPNGYWIVEISSSGDIRIEAFDDALQIGGDNIITNEPYNYVLPETGGKGILNYILIGIFTITTSITILIKKII